MTDTAVAVRSAEPRAITVITEELEKRESDLLAVLPPGMDAQRFMRVSLLAISKNPDLLKCSPGSVIRSIIEAAEIGLEPTGSLNRAWLIPFKDKDKPKPEAQLMIGYQGYADLMRDSGKVKRVTAEVVYEGDHFKVVKGSDEPHIEHEPKYLTEDPTKIEYVYAVAFFGDGEQQFEVMTRQQVEGIRAKSRSRNGPTWTQSWPQMARKTAIRRLANYVPLTARAVEAIARDDEREYGQPTATIAESRTAQVRDRLLNRGKEPEPALETTETPVEGEVTEAPVPEASAAGQGKTADVGAVCKVVSPFGEGSFCDQPLGHEGVHKAGGDETWPRS